jgi:hypothetical protein
LKKRQEQLHRPIAMLLKARKVRFLSQRQQTVENILAEIEFSGNLGNVAKEMYRLKRDLVSKFGSETLDSDTCKKLEKELEDFQNITPGLTATAIKNLEAMRDRLNEVASQPKADIPTDAQLGCGQLINKLNDDNHTLVIVQAHDPDQLREFASSLANIAYESRRKTGQITPLATFIFDEADEFIPQTGNESQKQSKAAVMTLARRGRKFGLGIGIATQRIRYLDTSVLAQPHTYLVSKLPRLTDRQAIAEAFGITEEMFRQTFKFRKGDWLLASYDAAGLEAIPIPIHIENAEDRLIGFLEQVAANRQND